MTDFSDSETENLSPKRCSLESQEESGDSVNFDRCGSRLRKNEPPNGELSHECEEKQVEVEKEEARVMGKENDEEYNRSIQRPNISESINQNIGINACCDEVLLAMSVLLVVITDVALYFSNILKEIYGRSLPPCEPEKKASQNSCPLDDSVERNGSLYSCSTSLTPPERCDLQCLFNTEIYKNTSTPQTQERKQALLEGQTLVQDMNGETSTSEDIASELDGDRNVLLDRSPVSSDTDRSFLQSQVRRRDNVTFWKSRIYPNFRQDARRNFVVSRVNCGMPLFMDPVDSFESSSDPNESGINAIRCSWIEKVRSGNSPSTTSDCYEINDIGGTDDIVNSHRLEMCKSLQDVMKVFPETDHSISSIFCSGKQFVFPESREFLRSNSAYPLCDQKSISDTENEISLPIRSGRWSTDSSSRLSIDNKEQLFVSPIFVNMLNRNMSMEDRFDYATKANLFKPDDAPKTVSTNASCLDTLQGTGSSKGSSANISPSDGGAFQVDPSGESSVCCSGLKDADSDRRECISTEPYGLCGEEMSSLSEKCESSESLITVLELTLTDSNNAGHEKCLHNSSEENSELLSKPRNSDPAIISGSTSKRNSSSSKGQVIDSPNHKNNRNEQTFCVDSQGSPDVRKKASRKSSKRITVRRLSDSILETGRSKYKQNFADCIDSDSLLNETGIVLQPKGKAKQIYSLVDCSNTIPFGDINSSKGDGNLATVEKCMQAKNETTCNDHKTSDISPRSKAAKEFQTSVRRLSEEMLLALHRQQKTGMGDNLSPSAFLDRVPMEDDLIDELTFRSSNETLERHLLSIVKGTMARLRSSRKKLLGHCYPSKSSLSGENSSRDAGNSMSAGHTDLHEKSNDLEGATREYKLPTIWNPFLVENLESFKTYSPEKEDGSHSSKNEGLVLDKSEHSKIIDESGIIESRAHSLLSPDGGSPSTKTIYLKPSYGLFPRDNLLNSGAVQLDRVPLVIDKAAEVDAEIRNESRGMIIESHTSSLLNPDGGSPSHKALYLKPSYGLFSRDNLLNSGACQLHRVTLTVDKAEEADEQTCVLADVPINTSDLTTKIQKAECPKSLSKDGLLPLKTDPSDMTTKETIYVDLKASEHSANNANKNAECNYIFPLPSETNITDDIVDCLKTPEVTIPAEASEQSHGPQCTSSHNYTVGLDDYEMKGSVGKDGAFNSSSQRETGLMMDPQLYQEVLLSCSWSSEDAAVSSFKDCGDDSGADSRCNSTKCEEKATVLADVHHTFFYPSATQLKNSFSATDTPEKGGTYTEYTVQDIFADAGASCSRENGLSVGDAVTFCFNPRDDERHLLDGESDCGKGDQDTTLKQSDFEETGPERISQAMAANTATPSYRPAKSRRLGRSRVIKIRRRTAGPYFKSSKGKTHCEDYSNKQRLKPHARVKIIDYSDLLLPKIQEEISASNDVEPKSIHGSFIGNQLNGEGKPTENFQDGAGSMEELHCLSDSNLVDSLREFDEICAVTDSMEELFDHAEDTFCNVPANQPLIPAEEEDYCQRKQLSKTPVSQTCGVWKIFRRKIAKMVTPKKSKKKQKKVEEKGVVD